jgi:ribosomal protein L11 methyltransferase
MDYLEFEFETQDTEELEKLVALLDEQGFEGFEEEESSLKAYIPVDKFNEAGFTSVLDLFENIGYSKSVVEQVNWNQKWEQDFKPVVVGDFVAIRADFHRPVNGVRHEIIITPKMSFGTGHHATTYLMIQQMQHLDFRGKSVLDFGTGTGVLAILAEKLGADKVLAIDYDEWSIINTSENINRNACEKVEAELGDAVPADQKFDVILANINLNILTANMDALSAACSADGRILLSGFLKENEEAMIEAIRSAGLEFLATHQRGDWITILVKHAAEKK